MSPQRRPPRRLSGSDLERSDRDGLALRISRDDLYAGLRMGAPGNPHTQYDLVGLVKPGETRLTLIPVFSSSTITASVIALGNARYFSVAIFLRAARYTSE